MTSLVLSFHYLPILLLACVHASPAWLKSTDSHAASFQMSKTNYNNYPWSINNATLSKISNDSKAAYGGLTDKCPDKVTEGNDVPVYRRSTCPWFYTVDHDPTRYPTTILKAMPTCQFCIGNSGHQCEAIMRTITVLKTVNTSGSAVEFIEKNENIPVGYTCAGVRTAANVTPTITTRFTFAK